ncbi:MAG: DUF4292 domain-containing protein [Pseudomonadota bacterium]
MLKIKLLPLIFSIIIILSSCSLHTAPKKFSNNLNCNNFLLKIEQIELDRNLENIKYQAKLFLNDSQSSKQVLVYVFIKENKKLRIEAVTDFGTTIFLLIINEKTLSLYRPNENAIYIGNNSSSNIHQVLGVAASSKLLFTLLSNRFPTFPENTSCTNNEDTIKLESKNNFTKKTVLISPQKKVIENYKYQDLDGNILEITYNDFKEVEGIMFPHEIKLHDPGKENKIIINVNAIFMKQKLDEKLFRISVPKNVEVRTFNGS